MISIGYDAKRMFNNNRGLGNYSRDLIRILSTYYPDNQYDLYTPKITLDINIENKNTNIITPKGFYKFLPSFVWRSIGMTSEIGKRKNVIYHGLNQEFPINIEKLDIQKVMTFHDAIFVRYPELYKSSYQKIFVKKNKNSCKIADKIIAISEQSKRDAIEFFHADERKISVIYQGCNNIFRKQCSDKEKITIKNKYSLPTAFVLYVGAIEPRKNINGIIRALSISKLDIPLIIVGRATDYVSKLKELAVKLGVSEKINFLHNVPTNDLPAIYQMADTFVFPSIFEGFGIPILEALCSGTPVITSSGSCFEETGGKSSVYVNPLDADEMNLAIEKVLTDSDLKAKMINDGLKHAETFTDDKIAKRVIDFYSNLDY